MDNHCFRLGWIRCRRLMHRIHYRLSCIHYRHFVKIRLDCLLDIRYRHCYRPNCIHFVVDLPIGMKAHHKKTMVQRRSCCCRRRFVVVHWIDSMILRSYRMVGEYNLNLDHLMNLFAKLTINTMLYSYFKLKYLDLVLRTIGMVEIRQIAVVVENWIHLIGLNDWI